ncbi:hypothetical protein R6Q57_027816 [Mikania cordata]
MLHKGGFQDAGMSYVGGLRVIVTFCNHEQARLFLDEKNKILKDQFSSPVIWYGQPIPFDRIVGLKVLGVPIQCRDNLVYDKIGNLFGRVIWSSEFSWEVEDNSSGFCYVLTSLRTIHQLN